MRHAGVIPALSIAHSPPTLAVQADVHDAMLDLHVPAQVALEVELAGAVGALEGLAAGVQVHVAQQVVHAVEGLPAHLENASLVLSARRAPTCPAPPTPPPQRSKHPCALRQRHPSFPMWPQRPSRQRNVTPAGPCSVGTTLSKLEVSATQG